MAGQISTTNPPPAEAVHVEHVDGTAILTIDYPPVNALSAPLRTELANALRASIGDPAVAAVIVAGTRGQFISGADIREFGLPRSPPLIADIQRLMETSHKPIVCAIDGLALGGGMEVALAAHARVASPRARFGLPEVTLGLVPGAGGTQRLTRLVGPELALDLILSGRQINAEEAAAMGIVEQTGEQNLKVVAIATARRMAATFASSMLLMALTDRVICADPGFFQEVRSRNARAWRGRVAPFKIVDCVEAATRLPPAEGLAFERAAFEQCEASLEHRALAHLFFARRAAAKLTGLDPDAKPMPIRSAGIVGAGTMGRGIAMALAEAGIHVRLLDRSDDQLVAAMALFEDHYSNAVARSKMSPAAAAEAHGRIAAANVYNDLGEADLLIEAVPETLELKREVFAHLDSVARSGALFATNTSALDVDTIASATHRRSDIVGLHFFAPARVMKLVEVVRGKNSSTQSLRTAMAFVKAIGKVPVLAGNREGFIGNRIFRRFGEEADALLLEGATPSQIDETLEVFGFAMGLYRVRDLSGLDVARQMRRNSAAARCHNSAPAEQMSLADRLCDVGRFGQKSGRGYYLYSGRTPRPDPEVERMLEEISSERQIDRQPVDDTAIIERLMQALASEGGAVLAEGVAERSSDIDVAMVFGFGFPAFRGGPMFFASHRDKQLSGSWGL